ncbi:MAG TPA: HAMP domain-containing sensor histidine kinase, partial [Chitinophagaceae bacterium]|nr:HAMP domain-containing sensor histidine kinase [Chitinophagaceae bacterium]
EVLLLAMLITILLITGFQLYWLKDNYNREKKTAELRAQSLFRETVRNLQDSVLQVKLQLVFKDSSTPEEVKRKMLEGHFRQRMPGLPRTARVVNLLGKKLWNDSIEKLHKGPRDIFIALDENAEFRNRDSAGKLGFIFDSSHSREIEEMMVLRKDQPLIEKKIDTLRLKERDIRLVNISPANSKDSNHKSFSKISTIFFNNEKGQRFSIKIDSLFKDSISVRELTTVFAKTLQDQKLNILFTISHHPEEISPEEDFIRRPFPADSFGGYKLQLGNAFSYLIKKISWPILFSVFLVGLTVFSFILLYRSLLRQHRLAQIKNDLISNITHELKTPIATVGVAIEALKNFNAIQDPQKTREYLDISHNELQRLGLLVDKVLKLSMFENKKIELKSEVFDLEEVVKEVVASLRLQLEKYNARINMNTEGNLLIKGDRMHLLSVVFNLLDNALKYSKGNAAIQVDIKEDKESVVLKVTDNGIGIPQEYRAKVFEKFFRVPTGDTHNAKGHGLGLSYAAQVIRQHQGNIEVESHEGLGSTFTIILPKSLSPNGV